MSDQSPRMPPIKPDEAGPQFHRAWGPGSRIITTKP
jgi:hypothetical protein